MNIEEIGHKAELLHKLVEKRDMLAKNFQSGEGVYIGWTGHPLSNIRICGDEADDIVKFTLSTLDSNIYGLARDLANGMYPNIKDWIMSGEDKREGN